MKNLYKALAKFQSEVGVIYKGAKAGKGDYAYKYASLPSVVEAITPHLKDAGLGFTQPIIIDEGVKMLKTTVFHTDSGEHIDSLIPIPDVTLRGQNDYQSLGSGITYLRRYTLEAILGLTTTKDDDAITAPATPKTQAKTQAKRSKPVLSPEHPNWRKAALHISGGGDIDTEICEKYALTKANRDLLIKYAEGLS